MSRWLVTGAGGMLGTDVVDVLRAAGQVVVAVPRDGLDITDPRACHDAVTNVNVVVNCAAWTDVDGAETDEAGAFAVNAIGAANVAHACHEADAVMVQISTDYVFSGSASAPYPVTADLAPVNAYGRTKAAGEWAVRSGCARSYVVRTAWLYGEHGACFPKAMLRLAAQRSTLAVVDDQRGQPTWTRDLAEFLRLLVMERAPFGIHHGTSSGETTWYEFARRIFLTAGLDPARIKPTTSQHFSRPAPRPAYSVLANQDLLPSWESGLSRAVPGLLTTG